MLTASVDKILQVTSGELLLGGTDFLGNDLFVDSRLVNPGAIFVALPGERTDGHDFLADAMEAGARVLVVAKSAEEIRPAIDLASSRGGIAVIRVADALAAIQDLARWHRDRLHATVVGITGSTGKTTTKDFLAAVLRTSLRVASTEGNMNNELGLPLSLLGAGSDTDVLILEMGMRGLGQIAKLTELARPDFGLVTNVGTSHIELLGSQDAVATAKGELVRAIAAEGAVFLNGDDAYSDALSTESKAPVVRYGLGESCDVTARDVQLDETSRASFLLRTSIGEVRVALPVPGRHNIYNALAAAAIAVRLGIDLDKIAEGLASASVSGMRMQVFTAASGVTVVNDAYNANPSSMRAAVETLASMATRSRRIAVLGDMAELGSLSELAHFQIGELVARQPIDVLITVGDRARRIADGARAEGMPERSVRPCVSAEEASEVLDDLLQPEDLVLVKASRVMGLERVVEGIVTPRVG